MLDARSMESRSPMLTLPTSTLKTSCLDCGASVHSLTPTLRMHRALSCAPCGTELKRCLLHNAAAGASLEKTWLLLQLKLKQQTPAQPQLQLQLHRVQLLQLQLLLHQVQHMLLPLQPSWPLRQLPTQALVLMWRLPTFLHHVQAATTAVSWRL